ncbi:MAG: CoA pyrophosphatase [Deltaproteobacteria bacterium]|nr:CoA pyrophosphatase [Deltaproteobacteria bacterium]
MCWQQIRNLLSRRTRKIIANEDRIPSAVLLLLYQREGEYCLIVTKRTTKVAIHKGQISFPGGVREPGDQSAEATALREASEEVGIEGGKVIILGLLDDVPTGESNYVITPVVGFLPARPSFKVNEDEVEELIEIPIFSFDRFVKGVRRKSPGDRECRIEFPEFRYGNHLIWGATARILEQFLCLLTFLRKNDLSPAKGQKERDQHV